MSEGGPTALGDPGSQRHYIDGWMLGAEDADNWGSQVDRAGGDEISSPYLKPMNCLFWNIPFNIFEPTAGYKHQKM